MAPTVAFRSKFPWAIPPERERIATDDLKDFAATAAREFRWHRAGRVPELCWPWRLAAELGWVIRCPVDIRMGPFRDFEVDAGPEHRAGLDDILRDYDLWMHHATPLAVSRSESRWMKLHDFQSEHGWQSMFIPNGRGTVEWHLGWACDWPADAFALFLPYRFAGPLEVIPGILDARHLAAAEARLGVSMAVRPVGECELRRGDPIARLVLLHADSLKAR